MPTTIESRIHAPQLRRRGALALLLTIGSLAIAPGVASAASTPVVFDATPAPDTNQTSATFRFHSPANPGETSFNCALDSGAFSACTSPETVTGISEGQHSFSVQTTTGTAILPPVTYTWNVDLTPPSTQVTGQPAAVTNMTSATFTFTSPDQTATFQCALNGGVAAACTSPYILSGLSDGTRSLLIQAVDPAGNVDPQAQPILWTVDTMPPDTVLANPGNIVANGFPVFSFTTSETGATFQCSLDSAPFTACNSPDVVSVSHSGSHVFKVRAVDAAGNADATPASYAWTADLTPPKRPDVTIFAAPAAHASRAAPLPTVGKSPTLGVTFTNPLAALLSTPIFTLATRLQAGWQSDATAKSFDVTLTEIPQDSTGMGYHGEDLIYVKQYSHTTRAALVLNVYAGTTVCVKVAARDKAGNTSKPKTACTTVPVSFTPRDPGPPPVKDPNAWRGYYIRLGDKGYDFVQDIGDEFFFTPKHVALVAEQCPHCGVVELAFRNYGNAQLRELATVDLNAPDRSGRFTLITVRIPVRRLQRDGEGQLVIRAASGRPRIAGIALTE